MMKGVRWSSHGWSHGKTPNSFSLGRETYSDLQHVNLQRKSRVNAWWEEHLIPQLPQEDPSVFILIGWTHPTFHIVSLEKKEKQCMVRGDISSHTQSLGKAPYSLSLLITTYSVLISICLPERKRKAMNSEMVKLVISLETPNSFGSGKKTHPVLQFVCLEKEVKSNAWWEERLIPQLTKVDTLFLI